MLSLLERNLWVSIFLTAGLGIVLVALVLGLGGQLPPLKPLPKPSSAASEALLRGDVQAWFSVEPAARAEPPTNSINPFFTLHFQPPPPPPTKKVELLYRGSLVSSKGEARAYVLLGDGLLILTNGARVVADHTIRDIGVQALTLTNAAGQTNVLKFNVKTVLEVPAS